MPQLTSIEMCAGAGGQALGLEQAGFHHLACVEIDADACVTLRRNRPRWAVLEADIGSHSIIRLAATAWRGVDLLAGGVPCPPFSVAGKQLGHEDERDLFPAMVDLAAISHPQAVLIENVRGLLDPRFDEYRKKIVGDFTDLGYVHVGWRLVNASQFGVPQLRPRVAMVALLPEVAPHFSWPEPSSGEPPTVGQLLLEQMASCGWEGAVAWASLANDIAPTIVGGSKKHGGPDLGPTRAKRAWERMGVNAHTIAELPPGPDFEGMPRLTVNMAAALQGFPTDWVIVGKKTSAYRQVGNAFPPPVARAIGVSIAAAIVASRQTALSPASPVEELLPADELRLKNVRPRERIRGMDEDDHHAGPNGHNGRARDRDGLAGSEAATKRLYRVEEPVQQAELQWDAELGPADARPDR